MKIIRNLKESERPHKVGVDKEGDIVYITEFDYRFYESETAEFLWWECIGGSTKALREDEVELMSHRYNRDEIIEKFGVRNGSR